MASGATTQVSRSSLPVLTKVPIAVRIRKKSDARKYRSAGSAGSFAGIVAEAAIGVKFHGSTRLGRGPRTAANGGTKDNALRAGGECGGSECGTRGLAREVGDGERGRRDDVREWNCFCPRNTRKVRYGYAKGPQRNGVVRDGVTRRRQQFQAERVACT